MQTIDLSGYRMVSIDEVARLFGLKPKSVKEAIYQGRFPVRPKLKRPYRWSSVELRDFFEDGRKRAL